MRFNRLETSAFQLYMLRAFREELALVTNTISRMLSAAIPEVCLIQCSGLFRDLALYWKILSRHVTAQIIGTRVILYLRIRTGISECFLFLFESWCIQGIVACTSARE